jgi:hypothetical protein
MTAVASLEAGSGGLDQGRAWRALVARAAALPPDWARTLLPAPGRFEACSRAAAGILLDFSRQPVDAVTLGLLVDLAAERRLPEWIAALFAGDPVNATEQRPALHMALRSEPACRPPRRATSAPGANACWPLPRLSATAANAAPPASRSGRSSTSASAVRTWAR